MKSLPAALPPARSTPGWIAPASLALAVLIFYWIPLTDANTSPQWDTIDYHYSVQKFAGEELRAFRLPHWSDFSYSGFPFLADPQVGVWYPLNWPFFLTGVTPSALEWEIALHVLIACAGAWLLANAWLNHVWASVVVAILYGFSGFFAGHASHLGMVQTAAWLPLILYGVHRSIESSAYATTLLTGTGCATLFLAGHFQSALYSFAAIGVYAAVIAALNKKWRPAAGVLVISAVATVVLSAIQWLPALQLAAESTRAGRTFETQTNAPLEPRALLTLISPNHYGSVYGDYTGPEDVTQFYLYGGIVLVPLAILGAISGRLRWAALTLLVPFLWYAFGPAAGFYSIAARLPGLNAVRAPVHAWFVVALGLALLAGAGLTWLNGRIKWKWLPLAIALISFSDVFYWNSVQNQLAYARTSFESRYGQQQLRFGSAVKQVLPDGARFHAPYPSQSFGPLNGSYELRLPVTYGSNPLPLQRYTTYITAAGSNRRLLNALHVGAELLPDKGAIQRNAEILPRFFFPKKVTAVPPEQSAGRLSNLDPLENAIVDGELGDLRQDPNAKASMESAEPERYTVRCEAASPSLLRAAVPWYPAWRATVDGQPVATRIVDHAMIGVPVPPGQHTVVLEYDDNRFRLGALITLISTAGLIAALVWLRRTPSQTSAGPSSSTTT